MERVGFHFHATTLGRNWRGLFSAVFVFVMFLVPTISMLRKNETHSEKFFALVFMLAIAALAVGFLAFLLVRSYREKFVLEFTESEIVDRRFWRLTRVPYQEVEIFSPTLDQIFQPDPRLREIRNELETEEFISITCRLKKSARPSGWGIKRGEYTFRDNVAPIDLSDSRMEVIMRKRLENKGIKFETL